VGGAGADHLWGNDGGDRLDSVDGIKGNDADDGGLGIDACRADPRDIRRSC
jgi:hypothetical protein